MKVVIIGGGIVGVFSALYTRQLVPTADIVLLDQDVRVGGLLRSDPHPNGLNFDRGTHILSWTGVPAIDDLLFNKLRGTDWHFYEGANRDLAGTMVENEVREGSPFLNVDVSLLASEWPGILAQCGTAHVGGEHSSLLDLLTTRFGAQIVDAVFRRPIRNLYGEELARLDPFVAAQLPLSRIVADGLDDWLACSSVESYRAIVACPEQRALPEAYTNKLRTAYPRRMGVEQLFATLVPDLRAAGVRLLLGTRLARIATTRNRVTGLDIEDRDRRCSSIQGEVRLVWAAPPFPLPHLLWKSTTQLQLRQPWKTVIVDFTAKLKQKLGCYYYVDYDDNACFRLTNYAAFCENARGLQRAPLTYEFWHRGGELTAADAHNLIEQRFQQLRLIDRPGEIGDVRVRQIAQGAVLPSIHNMQAIRGMTGAVTQRLPSNMLNVGLLNRSDLFFSSDLLRNAEIQLRTFLDGDNGT